MPFSSEIVGRQPSFVKRDVSRSFRGVPSGLLLSNSRSPSKPTTVRINAASSAMLMSLPQPTLTISERTVVLHQEHAGVCQVIHMQELAAR